MVSLGFGSMAFTGCENKLVNIPFVVLVLVDLVRLFWVYALLVLVKLP